MSESDSHKFPAVRLSAVMSLSLIIALAVAVYNNNNIIIMIYTAPITLLDDDFSA